FKEDLRQIYINFVQFCLSYINRHSGMKRILGLLLLFFLLSCDKNSTNRNPYLQEISFRFDLNLNLPLYSKLTNTGSAVYVGNAAVGTRGAFVINTGFNS